MYLYRIENALKNKKEKITEFGQFYILRIGAKYIHAKLLGSTRNYNAQLVKNSVVADVEIGENIYLHVKNESIQSGYGTKVKFEPIERLTDQAEIEKYILADRKRVADIYIKAAQDNLAKGWYSGDEIEKALFFSASHPDYKLIHQEIRLSRLKNIIESCQKYKWKLTDNFMILGQSTLQMFNEEKNLGDLDLASFEKSIQLIQVDLETTQKHVAQNVQDYINKLKGLIEIKTKCMQD